MIFFVKILRALASLLITNAHYVNVYPTDLIANGGLLGDVIFFAVSGYCLCNVKLPFAKWYWKRIYRVFPPVLIITLIYVLLGKYSLEEHGIFWWFVYPTYYHFVASIILLYIPFYFFMRIDIFNKNLLKLIGIIACVWLFVYISFYDKSYYHIDKVREPMIRFLFMESMLIGAWFRRNDDILRNSFKLWYPFVSVFLLVTYFISKVACSRIVGLYPFQIINQGVIIILLFSLFLLASSLDDKFEKLPVGIRKAVEFLASTTLEIYLVQYVLIDLFAEVYCFPLNWFIISASILLSAYLLKKITELFYAGIDKVLHSRHIE